MPIVRWAARILAILVSGMFLFLMAGEMLASQSGPPARLREWTGIALVCLTIIGMLLAWKWEASGALLSLAALGCFVFVAKMHRYGVVAVLAAPGTLFLADTLVRAANLKPRDQSG